MQFGLVLPNTGALASPDAIVRIAKQAESSGFETLWTADHLVLPVDNDTESPYAKTRPDPDLAILDPMIVLAAVASRTKKIKLGVSVYLATLRHPIVAAKLIASLDQISDGRVQLGVGAGWIPEEFQTMGIDFTERGRVLDEHLAALRVLFEQNRPEFMGKYFQFDNLGFEPKPVQSPLPIWVGGNTAAARRRVAKYGDGWHVIDVPAPELETGILDLRERCERAGRSLEKITISTRCQVAITKSNTKSRIDSAPLVGTLDEIHTELDRLNNIGVTHIALWPTRAISDLANYLSFTDDLVREICEPFKAVNC